MNKKNYIRYLARSIDCSEVRISYFERLKSRGDYDIIIKPKASNREPVIIEDEYKYEVINQIIHNYKQRLKDYNEGLDKELDKLLTPETAKATGDKQYVPPKNKRWYWGKRK